MLRKLFYPVGKIHKSYGKFLRWSFLSNIIISTENVISTHSMLSAINCSSTEAVISANYIGKDIVGQIGALAYMNKMGKEADKDPKKFTKYSNFFQQSAMAVECMTPIIPVYYFLPIAGVANIAKNVSFIGFGAINTKCINKISIDNNIGEIYSKIAIVNTLGSSIGMLFGLYLTAKIPDHVYRLSLLPLLAVFRIYTFNKAMNSVLDK
jgi:flagellar biosynthesis protein FlhB